MGKEVNLQRLVDRLSLGRHHEAQEQTVAAALRSLLVEDRRGVVLADEVGSGKTYEALAIMTLLCDHAMSTKRKFDRVLVLCKSSLVGKWREEITGAQPEMGFPQYVSDGYWRDHPVHRLLDGRNVRVVTHRQSATELRDEGLRGVFRDGVIQARPGLYIVNHHVLSENARKGRTLLGQLWRTKWDLVIVDEAHHYAKENRPTQIFAPDWDLRNYAQGISDGQFGRILALTGTPFELDPQQMVNLLSLVRADPKDIDAIKAGLALYVEHLGNFFSRRQRSPADPLRSDAVKKLRNLRDKDALGQGRTDSGLEGLLRRYLLRNTKSENKREYFLVNKVGESYATRQFDKLDDLNTVVREEPLIPFTGADAILYLQLRQLADRAAKEKRTFISTDLRQSLCSYTQLAKSSLLNRKLESAKQLSRVLEKWNDPRSPRLHPKLRALLGVVEEVAKYELQKLRRPGEGWLSKVLVFNTLIKSAPQAHDQLDKVLSRVFEEGLRDWLAEKGTLGVKQLRSRIRAAALEAIDGAEKRLRSRWGDSCRTPFDLADKRLRDFAGRPLMEMFKGMILARCRQALFLLHALHGGIDLTSDEAIGKWTTSNLLDPVETDLHRIIGAYLSCGDDSQDSAVAFAESAESDLLVLRESTSAVALAARYDGQTKDRESHRRNFNLPYNPFVLLVSRVGEEGIDLQKQCRYVIHYDLEWNPAKMEQREGRVDRHGWGRRHEGSMDVRFLLLKGTYEERIFHAVMQRDQWFQVLIGSKRTDLGKLPPDPEKDNEELPEVPDEVDCGRLTEQEKGDVMLDLRPAAVAVSCGENRLGETRAHASPAGVGAK